MPTIRGRHHELLICHPAPQPRSLYLRHKLTLITSSLACERFTAEVPRSAAQVRYTASLTLRVSAEMQCIGYSLSSPNVVAVVAVTQFSCWLHAASMNIHLALRGPI